MPGLRRATRGIELPHNSFKLISHKSFQSHPKWSRRQRIFQALWSYRKLSLSSSQKISMVFLCISKIGRSMWSSVNQVDSPNFFCLSSLLRPRSCHRHQCDAHRLQNFTVHLSEPEILIYQLSRDNHFTRMLSSNAPNLPHWGLPHLSKQSRKKKHTKKWRASKSTGFSVISV